MSAKIIKLADYQNGFIRNKRTKSQTLEAMNRTIQLLESLAISGAEVTTEQTSLAIKRDGRIEYAATGDANNVYFNAYDEIAIFESVSYYANFEHFDSNYCAMRLTQSNLVKSQRFANLIRLFIVKDIFSFERDIRVDTTFFENREKLAKMSFCFADFYQFAIAVGVAYRYEQKAVLDFKELNVLELERLELAHDVTVTDSIRKLFS